MTHEWKPGDVAVRTGKDGSEVRTMVAMKPSGALGGCLCTPHAGEDSTHWHHANGRWNPIPDDPDSGTYRPLVVIDPEDRDQIERLILTLPDAWDWGFVRSGADGDDDGNPVVDDDVFTNFRDALREFAQPTPPKPDEPTGLGAVVEDADGVMWVKARSAAKNKWVNDVGDFAAWAVLNVRRVVAEGVAQ